MISSIDGLMQSNGDVAPLACGCDLRRAVLYTVAYSDIFDFPLTVDEIHRYLTGASADRSTLSAILNNGSLFPHALSRRDDYITLPTREYLIDRRRERAARSVDLWGHARHYGDMLTRLPFVRMVAVTGELAVDNAQSRSDIDYFIVTEPGRLWLTRGMVILVVKLAARRGVTICPNYLVTEDALEFDNRNLYTARELAQMVPLSGIDVYHRIRQANPWVLDYLPNAVGPPTQFHELAHNHRARRISEMLLRTPVGEQIEQWEMRRKIRKFTREAPAGDETAFSADWCKGHFDTHGQRTLEAYAERVEVVEKLLQ